MSESAAEQVERNWLHWTEPEWAEIEGAKTAYRRGGSGQPLLFLHGAGLTRMWLPFYDALSRSFDVVAPEQPGFGDSELPDWIQSFEDLVLHYDALLRGLSLTRPHLVGFSLGGWLAANLAIFYPERFRSLTLIAPMGLRVPGAPANDPFRLAGDAALECLFSGCGAKYLDYFAQGDEIDSRIQAYAESTAFARLAWNPRYDYRLDRRLGRVTAPTLVIGPADDRFLPQEHAKRYAELIPGAILRLIHGRENEPASHLALIQYPLEVAEMVMSHAAGVDSNTDAARDHPAA